MKIYVIVNSANDNQRAVVVAKDNNRAIFFANNLIFPGVDGKYIRLMEIGEAGYNIVNEELVCLGFKQ